MRDLTFDVIIAVLEAAMWETCQW